MKTILTHAWLGRMAALIGGAAWSGLVLLEGAHDFWSSPIGSIDYEDFNRIKTLPLLLLVVAWAVLHTRYARAGSRMARGTSWAVLAGLGCLLMGNVLEFWPLVLQSRYVPFRMGGPNAWPGAMIGWSLFVLGMLLVPVALVLFGIITVREQLLPRWSSLPLSIGIVGLVGFVVMLTGDETGFAVALLALGAGWLLLSFVFGPVPQRAPAARGEAQATI